jgi:hypothetical protein
MIGPSQAGTRRKDSAADARSCDTGRARTWVSTPSFSVSITAQTHWVVLVSLGVLPIIPIVQAKATLPRFGHGANSAPRSTGLGSSCRAANLGRQVSQPIAALI